MELAKIRSKAQQESIGAPPSQTAAAVPADLSGQPQETVQPPALVLPDDLFDQVGDECAFAEAGASSALPVTPPVRFNPLATILAGRVADSQSEQQIVPVDVVPDQDQEACQEFLCFRLYGEEYGINIMEIKEIIKPRELTEVPRAPGFIDGILSLRGVIVPVIDMRKRLGLPNDSAAPHQRIVIVKQADSLTGLRVDEVTGVVRILESRRETTPAALEGIDRDFVSGIGRTDNRMVILLDIGTVADAALAGGV